MLNKREEMEKQEAEAAITENDKKETSSKPEPPEVIQTNEEGRGVKKTPKKEKTKESASPQEQNLFSKNKKDAGSSKSVYLTDKNIEFLNQMKDKYGIPFSEVINRIIGDFREKNS